MLSRLTVAAVLLFCVPILSAQETNEAIHEELRALLSGIETAVNSESYGDIAQYFHEDAHITTINQEFISSNGEIEPYFDRWFGEGGYLKTLKMSLDADALTEFYGDGSFGVVRGSGEEDYVLSDTRSFPMKTRWTATVSKNADGEWRILTLHIGTNFLDNPILSVAERSAKYFGAGGAAGGLVLGLLLGFAFWRRKPVA
jgi:ketosteroid isomerase-like protein